MALESAKLGDRQQLSAALMGGAKQMVMPPGKTLWDLIPGDQEGAIRHHENLAAGAAGALHGYQPWVVTMMPSLPPSEQQRENAGHSSFDELIAHHAYR